MKGVRKAPGGIPGAENEGVGEHVRIKSHLWRPGPGETADRMADLHRAKKSCFFCRTGPSQRSCFKFDPTVDLMSRRHPLSSPEPVGRIRSRERPALTLRRRAGIKAAGQSRGKRESYFFLETFLVFFAVFFTALFAFLTVFFAFLAFLAMLPSDVRWLIRCVHSGIEMHYFSNTPTQRKKQLPA